jgi:hypothetical protein
MLVKSRDGTILLLAKAMADLDDGALLKMVGLTPAHFRQGEPEPASPIPPHVAHVRDGSSPSPLAERAASPAANPTSAGDGLQFFRPVRNAYRRI